MPSTAAGPSPKHPSTDAVILCSGGLDSAVTLALARAQGLRCHALSFDYGQRHKVELSSAAKLAAALGAARHTIAHLDIGALAGSALTDPTIAVPKDRPHDALSREIPTTYVPARNLIFLSCAVGVAEASGAREVHIGVNAIDFSGYPDCRPDFIEAFERCAALATKVGAEGATLRVRTPLIQMSKADIIRTGARLGVDFSLTQSCYDPTPNGLACGHCDACALRRDGFTQAGVPDPTQYAPE